MLRGCPLLRRLLGVVTPGHRIHEFRDGLPRVTNVYFETAFSSVRAWSIWSYA